MSSAERQPLNQILTACYLYTLVGSRRLGVGTHEADWDFMAPIDAVHISRHWRPITAYAMKLDGTFNGEKASLVALPSDLYQHIDQAYSRACATLPREQLLHLRQKFTDKREFYRALRIPLTADYAPLTQTISRSVCFGCSQPPDQIITVCQERAITRCASCPRTQRVDTP